MTANTSELNQAAKHEDEVRSVEGMFMDNTDALLEFAETLIHAETDTYCSDLQRRILITALQRERKTYEQLAEECGYSMKYVKQVVAPKFWQLLSQALNQKVTKSNVRFLLEQKMHSAVPQQPVSSASTIPSTTVAPDSVAILSPQNRMNSAAKAKILLVDDQPKNLRLLSDLLEEQGYSVRQAIDGIVALETIALEKPDLVLLDIHMPGMDGYTVCQQIKTEPATQDIPVIFVSALDEAWDKVKAFSAGGADYIHKPFKVVEVLARVENQLRVRQLQQALADQNQQLQQALEEVQRLATIDELTQVANHHRLEQYLLTSWQHALQTHKPLTLLLCQVDNVSFDREEANSRQVDHDLYAIAQVFKRTMPGENSLVGRYGLVTFAVVLPEQTETVGDALAKTLLQEVQALALGSCESKLTLSIGLITEYPTSEADLEDTLQACEHRLQKAKRQGGNHAYATI